MAMKASKAGAQQPKQLRRATNSEGTTVKNVRVKANGASIPRSSGVATVDLYQAEFDRIEEQMKLDGAEIERLKVQTQTRIDDIHAVIEAMRAERPAAS